MPSSDAAQDAVVQSEVNMPVDTVTCIRSLKSGLRAAAGRPRTGARPDAKSDELTEDAKAKSAAKQKAKPSKPIGAVRNWRDLRALPPRAFALPICPRRSVVMMAGSKSVGKTFTVDCLCSMVGYGVSSYDGTRTKRGLAFICTDEDRQDWANKHAAWLALMGKPQIEQDNVKLIDPDDQVFHRDVETKRHGTVKIDRLDLLDPVSVDIFIKQCQQTSKAENLATGYRGTR